MRLAARPSDQNPVDKDIGSQLRELAGEGAFDHRIEAECFQYQRLFRGRCQPVDRLVRDEHAARMGLEGQNERGLPCSVRRFQCTLKHSLMTTMHAIKIADRHDRAFEMLGQMGWIGQSQDGHVIPQARAGIVATGLLPCFSRKAKHLLKIVHTAHDVISSVNASGDVERIYPKEVGTFDVR